jgi:hypothetical protein
MSDYAPKTKISDIPVANERLYEETARLTKTKVSHVEEIIEFTGKFVADTIAAGTMQAVMLPYFGKFRPKIKYLRRLKQIERTRENGTRALYLAMKGQQPRTKLEGNRPEVYEEVEFKGHDESTTPLSGTTEVDYTPVPEQQTEHISGPHPHNEL